MKRALLLAAFFCFAVSVANADSLTGASLHRAVSVVTHAMNVSSAPVLAASNDHEASLSQNAVLSVIEPVPEPSSVVLLCIGLFCLAGLMRWKRLA